MTKLAIRKDIDPTFPLEDPEQEEFCRLYGSEREFFGNGTQSYIEAFGIDITEKGAAHRAAENARYLLKKPVILARIRNFLDLNGFNDENADKNLLILMNQNADFRAKAAAIKEYNALKGRIKQKYEFAFHNLSDAELEAERKALEREIIEAEIVETTAMPKTATSENVVQSQKPADESQASVQ